MKSTEDVVVENEEEQSASDLDRAIEKILLNNALTNTEKHFHYYNVISRHLYKLDPKFKPDRFAFDIHTDPTCRDDY